MSLFKKISQNQLFKVTSLNSIGVVVKILTGLITSKFLAVYVGPSGMALLGNLKNFTTILEGISTLGFQTGIVKYVGENENNKEALSKLVTTLLISFLLVTAILSTLLFTFSDYLCKSVLGQDLQFSIVFKATALALPWYILSILFTLIINGLSYFKKTIIINILGNIIGLIVSIIFILKLKTLGALMAVTITPSLFFFISICYLPKKIGIFKKINFKEFDYTVLKNLSAFSVMLLTSAIFGPLFSFAIRKNIITNLGLEEAGLCEAMTKISSSYLIFISSLISLYFYPNLIKAKNNFESKIIIWKFYKYLMPLFIIGAILIFYSRFFIIELLFTKDFLTVTDLFLWQLIADFFKVGALILGLLFFTKKMVVAHIISELFSYLLLYFSSIFFINYCGIQGVIMAQVLDNFLYLVVLIFIFRINIF